MHTTVWKGIGRRAGWVSHGEGIELLWGCGESEAEEDMPMDRPTGRENKVHGGARSSAYMRDMIGGEGSDWRRQGCGGRGTTDRERTASNPRRVSAENVAYVRYTSVHVISERGDGGAPRSDNRFNWILGEYPFEGRSCAPEDSIVFVTVLEIFGVSKGGRT